jgi:hypothetical protein
VAHDLIFGRTPRDWSLGLEAQPIDLSPKAPAPTSSELLEAKLAAKKPTKPSKSVERMVLDKAHEAAPETMALYDKYRPTYRDSKVILRMKTNLLGEMLGG